MNSPILTSQFIHPRERVATEKLTALTEKKAWANSSLGDNLDDVNTYICQSSFLRVPEHHPLHCIMKDAAERFELDNLPELYIDRRFSYDVRLSGYDKPAVIFPAVLLEHPNEQMLLCRACAAAASVKAGHHRYEFLLWLTENTADTIPLPFVGQATTGLLYEWRRTMVFSQDRGVYLATGDAEAALRNILYGTVSDDILDNFCFGLSNPTFLPQLKRYNEGILENTVGRLTSFLQNQSYLPERYMELVTFIKKE